MNAPNDPDDLGDWAALYRDARRPPPELAARIFDACTQDDHAPPPAKQRWGVGLMLGALIGVAALVALTWSMDTMRASPATNAGAVEAPMQADPPADRRGAALPLGEAGGRRPPVEQPGPQAAIPDRVPVQPAVSRAPKRRTPTKTAPSTPDPSASAKSVDLESMRRLRAAEALLERDPSGARRALEQHARDYPRSAMMLEREALWIRAACASQVGKDLERRKKAFFQRADIDAYRAAIRRACT